MSQLNTDLQKTDKADKIPVGEKLAYAVGEIPNNLPNTVPTVIANQVFVFSMGIPATMVSVVLALFRLVDAFTDPLIGHWSDNFRSKWGRRRPFMVIGAIATAVSLPLVYMFPQGWSDFSTMAWFFIFGSIFFFCSSIYNIPTQSLALEMTPDYHERTSIFAFRSFIANIMRIGIGWLWFITQLPIFSDPETGQPDTLNGAIWLSFIVAVLVILVGFIPPIFCKERYYDMAIKSKRESFWGSFRATIKCKPFAIILGMLIFLNIPNLTNGLGAYLTTFMLFGGEQKGAAFLSGIGSTLGIIMTLCSIPITTKLTRHFGKENVLRAIIFFNIPVAIAYWFIYAYATEETAWLTVLPGFLYAPLMTGFWMVLPSMQADIVDYDELQTGERREGTFAAVFSWFLKFSAVAMVGFAGPIIDLIGFDPELMANQHEGVFLKMRILLCAVPIIAVICQLWLLSKYPISPEIAHQNREELERRRGAINGA